MNWIKALSHCDETQCRCVLASIISTHGSSPRGVDAKMVITADGHHDTIGGGAFEHLVIQNARSLLRQENPKSLIIDIPLGPDIEQCCGGYVGVLLEPLFCEQQRVFIFGAGTISNEIAKIFESLPVSLTRYDNRDEFIGKTEFGSVKKLDNINAICQNLEQNDDVYVMTHDHTLDYQIISKLLLNKRITDVHLIGSNTKAARFRNRLKRDGFCDSDIERLICPIAREHITSRKPMAIAIAICHDYLSRRDFNEKLDNAIDIKPYLNKRSTRH